MTRETFDTNMCDVLLDLPAVYEPALTTFPIYRTTYVLAYRSDRGIDIKDFDDPELKKLKIGVFQTSSMREVLAQRGLSANLKLHTLSHNADLKPENQPWRQVQDVIDGKLDVAGVWGPFAGWLKTMKGQPIAIEPVNLWEDVVPMEFELAAGVRRTDARLKYMLELALEATKGEIEKILTDYGVPLVAVQPLPRAGRRCPRTAPTPSRRAPPTSRSPRRQAPTRSSRRSGSRRGSRKAPTSRRSFPTPCSPSTRSASSSSSRRRAPTSMRAMRKAMRRCIPPHAIVIPS